MHPTPSESSKRLLAPRWRTAITTTVLAILAFAAVETATRSVLHAQDYVRPVEAAPQPEDIGEDYTLPPEQRSQPREGWLRITDIVLLSVALLFVSWAALKRRSRKIIFGVTVGCVAYFGFYREGCVCPIGATQNVVVALTDPGYSIPLIVVLIFFLPLVVTLLFGRSFCGGVCPLGAIQDLVVLRPLQVPRRLDRALGLFKYAYLGLAIWFAARPALEREFIICRFDPFVGLFRLTGPAHMLMIGGGLLLLGMFVGRIYCRWLCPYGGLLALLSRLSWKKVSITPDRELDCGLCARSCPFGAIEKMRAVRSSCLSCARCFDACPVERQRRGRPVLPEVLETRRRTESRETVEVGGGQEDRL